MKVLIRMPARLHFATSSKVWLTTRGSSPKALDRKSTRLNSSHGYISYAVFCLKKKKNDPIPNLTVTTDKTTRALWPPSHRTVADFGTFFSGITPTSLQTDQLGLGHLGPQISRV